MTAAHAILFADMTASGRGFLAALKGEGVAFERQGFAGSYAVLARPVALIAVGVLWWFAYDRDRPFEAVIDVAIAFGIGWVLVRALDFWFAARLVADDTGLTLWRRGVAVQRIAWQSVRPPRWYLRPLPAVWASTGAWIVLPTAFKGKPLLAAFARWCGEHHEAIARARGSVTGALKAMVAGEGIGSEGDKWALARGAGFSSLVFAGALAVYLTASPELNWVMEIFVAVFLMFWALARFNQCVVVSALGVSTVKDGQTILNFSWRQMSEPAALAQRKREGLLACAADGAPTIAATAYRYAGLLEAVVEDRLAQEIGRHHKGTAASPLVLDKVARDE
jgi:hypothetical protein